VFVLDDSDSDPDLATFTTIYDGILTPHTCILMYIPST
jgi:hypothetical protein